MSAQQIFTETDLGPLYANLHINLKRYYCINFRIGFNSETDNRALSIFPRDFAKSRGVVFASGNIYLFDQYGLQSSKVSLFPANARIQVD